MNQPYEKAKIAKIIIGVYAFLAMAYLLLLFWTNQRVFAVDVSGCELAEPGEIAYGFDKLKCEYGYVDIRGYAYEKGVSVERADTAVLARDPATGTYYKLPTEVVSDETLTTKENDGCNYDYAQFRSVAFLNKFPKGSAVCIWYRVNGESKLIQTDQVIDHD